MIERPQRVILNCSGLLTMANPSKVISNVFFMSFANKGQAEDNDAMNSKPNANENMPKIDTK